MRLNVIGFLASKFDDPFAGGFSGVGKDTVVGLDLVDEGVDGACRVCCPLIVVGQERFDLVEGEGRQVRLVEPVDDGDAAIFDTIPPELGLSTWGEFPIVGNDGAAKKVSRTYKPILWKEIRFGTVLAEWVIC
jgi:hypothetical protein